MLRRVLVTGGAGFIGEHVSRVFANAGWTVKSIDAFRAKVRNIHAAQRLRRDGIIVEAADLVTADLEAMLTGIDCVVHLAGRPGVRDRDVYALNRDNVDVVERLLNAANVREVRVLLASSSSVAALPDAPMVKRPQSYAESKRYAEQLVAQAANRHSILRLFSVYGPGQRPEMAFASACKALRTGVPFTVFGDGSHQRDWTYVGDVATAFLAAAEAPPGVFDVGAGQPYALSDALDLLQSLAGTRLRRQYEEPDPLDCMATAADLLRDGGLKGWWPHTRLKQGLTHQWAAFQSPYAAPANLAEPGYSSPSPSRNLDKISSPTAATSR